MASVQDVSFIQQPSRGVFDPMAAYEIQRRQKFSEMLMEQGKQPQGTEVVGGVAVKQSPMAALARALTQGVGGYEAGQANKLAIQNEMARRQALADAIGGGQSSSSGQGAAISKALEASYMGAPDAVLKGIIDYGSPTSEMKNAGAGLAPPTGTNMTFGDPTAPAPSQSMGFSPSMGRAPMPPSNQVTQGGVPVNQLPPVMRQAMAAQDQSSPMIPPPATSPSTDQLPTVPQTQIAYQNGKPLTEGLEQGKVWARDENGQLVEKQIPNIDAKQKLEYQLKYLSDKFDELKNKGGAVSSKNGWQSLTDNNLVNTMSGSQMTLPDWAGGGEIGGQDVARIAGTPASKTRDDINAAIRQTVPLYMAAMGITPGMERAVSAQQMLKDALGGAPTKSYEHNKEQLSRLSTEAGLGTVKYEPQKGDSHPDNIALKHGLTPEDIAAYKKLRGIK